MDAAKNNEKAAQIRREGNQLYQQKEFYEALKKYNESICWAENGSEDLGIGFANRSAMCYERKDYEFSLINIALARSHNYPERLMPKLEKRERECQLLIRQMPPPEKADDDDALRSRLSINVEVNPRIPFIAKDIRVEELAELGRGAIVDRDFKVGDVIVLERPLMTCANRGSQYLYCNFCTSEVPPELIPCQHCVSVMYCGVECRQKSWKQYHRFECGLIQQLFDVFEKTKTSFIAPRFFFYTLGLFNDDISEMGKFCEANPRTGSNPLTLDYVNYDRLEEAKEIYRYRFHKPIGENAKLYTKSVALKYLKVFRQSALVTSLFTTNGQMKFLQERFVEIIPLFPALHSDIRKVIKYFVMTSILCNVLDLTRNPNVSVVSNATENVIVVHQPVQKGSPLCVQGDGFSPVKNKCPNCPLCSTGRDVFSRDYETMWRVIMVGGVNGLAKLNAIQQFLQKYSDTISFCRYETALKLYQELLYCLMDRFASLDWRAKAKAKAIAYTQ